MGYGLKRFNSKVAVKYWLYDFETAEPLKDNLTKGATLKYLKEHGLEVGDLSLSVVKGCVLLFVRPKDSPRLGEYGKTYAKQARARAKKTFYNIQIENLKEAVEDESELIADCSAYLAELHSIDR